MSGGVSSAATKQYVETWGHRTWVNPYKVWVPGKPRPVQRPRFTNGRTYTTQKDTDYREKMVARWADAGQPCLAEGNRYWWVDVTAQWERPDSHFMSDGVTLSASGRKMVWPAYCDLDNILKHIDVLVAVKAVTDDRYCVHKVVRAAWASEEGVLFQYGEIV